MTNSVFDTIANNQQKAFGSSNERPTRKYDFIRPKDAVEASKNGVFYRILPLGNRWAFTSYYQIFATIHSQSGSSFTLPINFPDMSTFPKDAQGKAQGLPEIWGGEDYDTANDELFNLLRTIVNYNESLIKNKNATSDVIRLSENAKIPHTRMNTIREIVTIPERYDSQNHRMVPLAMSKFDPNMPAFANIPLNYSSYKSLYSDDMLGQKYYANPNHEEFTSPLYFIRDDYNMPIYFKEAGTTGYSVEVKESLGMAEGLPQNYLETDSQGLFKHFDDPYIFNAPITDPDFRNNVILPYIKSLASQMSGTTVTGTSFGQPQQPQVPQQPSFASQPQQNFNENPYAQQAPQAPQTPSFSENNSGQQAPQSQPQAQTPNFANQPVSDPFPTSQPEFNSNLAGNNDANTNSQPAMPDFSAPANDNQQSQAPQQAPQTPNFGQPQQSQAPQPSFGTTNAPTDNTNQAQPQAPQQPTNGSNGANASTIGQNGQTTPYDEDQLKKILQQTNSSIEKVNKQ